LKIAISTDSGQVSPHFGRAPEFTIITIENNRVVDKKVFQNPGHSIGSIPKFINEKGAHCMITGGMGPRAVEFFRQYGIDIIMGVNGSVDNVIEEFLKGTLKGGESICSPGRGKGYGIDKIHTEEDNYHNHHNHH